MIDRAAATFLIVALASAGIAPASASESAAAPQMNTGHTANRSPKTATVSPTADQIEASNVIGANVQNATGADIAKIADLLIDRHRAVAALAIVAPEGSKSFGRGTSAIAWSGLRFQPRPTPHFVTRLSARELAAGSALVEQAKTGGGYYDLKTDLLGRQVAGPDGAPLGHVQNVVLTLGKGVSWRWSSTLAASSASAPTTTRWHGMPPSLNSARAAPQFASLSPKRRSKGHR